jgi:hypothetical protein
MVKVIPPMRVKMPCVIRHERLLLTVEETSILKIVYP